MIHVDRSARNGSFSRASSSFEASRRHRHRLRACVKSEIVGTMLGERRSRFLSEAMVFEAA